jgi:NNP family nitrate/nitrite transporter-like MFS transporter
VTATTATAGTTTRDKKGTRHVAASDIPSPDTPSPLEPAPGVTAGARGPQAPDRSTARDELGGPTATKMLALATVGFALCFWAWALISPLGSAYAADFGLSAFEQALLVAVPVIVGSLGRIPVGALTDRLGAKVMFPAIAALTIIPVLFVGFAGVNFPLVIVGGFFLGLGGTSFAVGVPLVNSWFPPARRGTAVGIFGAGMGGTAIAAFSTVAIADAWGRPAPFVIVAILLAIYALAARALLVNPPGRPVTGVAAGSLWVRAWQTLREPVTLKLSWLYAIGFGGFVAFSVYLPTYLVNAYGMERGDAALRTAGFVVLAVAMRPIGGWLSDKLRPVPVLTVCFALTAVFATGAAAGLHLMPQGTVVFLGLAAVLGAASGAVFALVAELVEPARVGAVTGIVGAAGGLGGFVPPLIMGVVYGATGHYAIGLGLLAAVGLATAIFAWLAFRTRPVPSGD